MSHTEEIGDNVRLCWNWRTTLSESNVYREQCKNSVGLKQWFSTTGSQHSRVNVDHAQPQSWSLCFLVRLLFRKQRWYSFILWSSVWEHDLWGRLLNISEGGVAVSAGKSVRNEARSVPHNKTAERSLFIPLLKTSGGLFSVFVTILQRAPLTLPPHLR